MANNYVCNFFILFFFSSSLLNEEEKPISPTAMEGIKVRAEIELNLKGKIHAVGAKKKILLSSNGSTVLIVYVYVLTSP